MENVLNGIIVPHPPLILPNVGKGSEKCIEDIAKDYQKAADEIIEANPETVVIITPHAPSYYDYIQISDGKSAHGNMGQFNDYEDSFNIQYDTDFVKELSRLAEEEGIPAGTLGRQDGTLDHATMVPLYFLKGLKPETKFVRVSIGGPDNLMHYKLGRQIAKAANNLGKKISIVASADLSHCQKPGPGYGYKPCGPAYDAKIQKLVADKDIMGMLNTSEKELDDAMVCGHKPIVMMSGAFDGEDYDVDVLGHSAVTGVGYMVATYNDSKEDESRKFYEKALKEKEEKEKDRYANSDAYVLLAKDTIDQFVRKGHVDAQHLAKEFPQLLKEKAGVFVSIHENGQLRGCIGTTAPVYSSVFEEIIQNGMAASSRDPRFPRIQPWELEDLDINVDVLGASEPVHSLDELDVKKYGVIITKGNKRGLLLPDLEGVDTVEQQLSIAKQKAGIDPGDNDVELERFEVVRHL